MTGASTNKEGISIIIPIYNEAERLPAFITLLFDTLESNHYQIIFVDGGSKDDSCKIIQANPSCSLIHSKKGRAIQMNTGAKKAHYPLLYFIHVDSIPPKGFDQILLDQFKQGQKAGCFQMILGFVAVEINRFLLKKVFLNISKDLMNVIMFVKMLKGLKKMVFGVCTFIMG